MSSGPKYLESDLDLEKTGILAITDRSRVAESAQLPYNCTKKEDQISLCGS